MNKMIEKKYRDEKLLKNLQERMSEINAKLNSKRTSKKEKKALNHESLENLLTFIVETKYPKSPEAVEETKRNHRNERIIAELTLKVFNLFELNNPSENQEEIEFLQRLIYEELSKRFFLHSPKIPSHVKEDIKDRRRILKNIEIAWGKENYNRFSKTYPTKDLLSLYKNTQ